MTVAHFSVDAALLRELGERLVGRGHIALAELVKNAYDADASTCRIVFGPDSIRVIDDGKGMTTDDFLTWWLRVGTTHKTAEQFSTHLGRPLTGSKGVGRLAVQFLGAHLRLLTVSLSNPDEALQAEADWDAIKPGDDLETFEVTWGTQRNPGGFPRESRTGTSILLTGLKDHWGSNELKELGREVWMLRSPFRRKADRRDMRPGEDFDVEVEAPEIEGARQAFDASLDSLLSNWKARIRGELSDGRKGGVATLRVDFRKGYPEGSERAEFFSERIAMPVRPSERGGRSCFVDQASFEILVFRTEGRQPGGISVFDMRDYLADFGNVSVFDAGFRLPYYGSGRNSAGQDWLSIALDQGRRITASELLPDRLRTPDRYMLDLPAPGRIFGGLDVDSNHERVVAEAAGAAPDEWLQLQSGRDRLHDNKAFAQLRDLVRLSLDFYANRYRLLSVQSVERRRHSEPPTRKFDRAIALLEENKGGMPALAFQAIRREVMDARKAASVEEEAQDQRAALLAPLASAGMAALSLNHELARETRFMARIGERLRGLGRKHGIEELAEIAGEFGEVSRRLDALQELFAPLLSDMDKAVTDRLKVAAVVEHAVGAMRVLMPGVSFDASAVPSDLRFPTGSFAEWSALLQNLLSNAWNAILDADRARIAFSGGRTGRGAEWLRVSDTGVGLGVPLIEAAKLFEPFERALTIDPNRRSIAIGGSGLGLSIVRMIAGRRGASVAFVDPAPGFSTAFELSWKG